MERGCADALLSLPQATRWLGRDTAYFPAWRVTVESAVVFSRNSVPPSIFGFRPETASIDPELKPAEASLTIRMGVVPIPLGAVSAPRVAPAADSTVVPKVPVAPPKVLSATPPTVPPSKPPPCVPLPGERLGGGVCRRGMFMVVVSDEAVLALVRLTAVAIACNEAVVPLFLSSI